MKFLKQHPLSNKYIKIWSEWFLKHKSLLMLSDVNFSSVNASSDMNSLKIIQNKKLKIICRLNLFSSDCLCFLLLKYNQCILWNIKVIILHRWWWMTVSWKNIYNNFYYLTFKLFKIFIIKLKFVHIPNHISINYRHHLIKSDCR